MALEPGQIVQIAAIGELVKHHNAIVSALNNEPCNGRANKPCPTCYENCPRHAIASRHKFPASLFLAYRPEYNQNLQLVAVNRHDYGQN